VICAVSEPDLAAAPAQAVPSTAGSKVIASCPTAPVYDQFGDQEFTNGDIDHFGAGAGAGTVIELKPNKLVPAHLTRLTGSGGAKAGAGYGSAFAYSAG
jgi:hypothetical protein